MFDGMNNEERAALSTIEGLDRYILGKPLIEQRSPQCCNVGASEDFVSPASEPRWSLRMAVSPAARYQNIRHVVQQRFDPNLPSNDVFHRLAKPENFTGTCRPISKKEAKQLYPCQAQRQNIFRAAKQRSKPCPWRVDWKDTLRPSTPEVHRRIKEREWNNEIFEPSI